MAIDLAPFLYVTPPLALALAHWFPRAMFIYLPVPFHIPLPLHSPLPLHLPLHLPLPLLRKKGVRPGVLVHRKWVGANIEV